MIDFDDFVNLNIKEHNPNRPQIPDHYYRILIIGYSGSWKRKFIIQSNKLSIRY